VPATFFGDVHCLAAYSKWFGVCSDPVVSGTCHQIRRLPISNHTTFIVWQRMVDLWAPPKGRFDSDSLPDPRFNFHGIRKFQRVPAKAAVSRIIGGNNQNTTFVG
jgi:hypothetical protein